MSGKKTEWFKMRSDKETIQKLNQLALYTGKNCSEVVRELIDRADSSIKNQPQNKG